MTEEEYDTTDDVQDREDNAVSIGDRWSNYSGKDSIEDRAGCDKYGRDTTH